MAKINKINHIKCWNGYDLTRILIYYWWELVMINHFGKAISHKDMYICVCVYVCIQDIRQFQGFHEVFLFPTSHLCKVRFSSCTSIKNNIHNRLNSEAGMRIQRDLQNYKTTTFIKYVILESLVFFVAIYQLYEHEICFIQLKINK